jgi:hypothetical protein
MILFPWSQHEVENKPVFLQNWSVAAVMRISSSLISINHDLMVTVWIAVGVYSWPSVTWAWKKGSTTGELLKSLQELGEYLTWWTDTVYSTWLVTHRVSTLNGGSEGLRQCFNTVIEIVYGSEGWLVHAPVIIKTVALYFKAVNKRIEVVSEKIWKGILRWELMQ